MHGICLWHRNAALKRTTLRGEKKRKKIESEIREVYGGVELGPLEANQWLQSRVIPGITWRFGAVAKKEV